MANQTETGPQGFRSWPRPSRQAAGAKLARDVYRVFEQAVALVLVLLICGVIIAAVLHLARQVAEDIFVRGIAPVDLVIFQEIFGMIMIVVIALEFNHTIIGVLEQKESIAQLRIVILIAILAIARKFIILDVTAAGPLAVFGLGFAVLALGFVYWLVREQGHRRI